MKTFLAVFFGLCVFAFGQSNPPPAINRINGTGQNTSLTGSTTITSGTLFLSSGTNQNFISSTGTGSAAALKINNVSIGAFSGTGVTLTTVTISGSNTMSGTNNYSTGLGGLQIGGTAIGTAAVLNTGTISGSVPVLGTGGALTIGGTLTTTGTQTQIVIQPNPSANFSSISSTAPGILFNNASSRVAGIFYTPSGVGNGPCLSFQNANNAGTIDLANNNLFLNNLVNLIGNSGSLGNPGVCFGQTNTGYYRAGGASEPDIIFSYIGVNLVEYRQLSMAVSGTLTATGNLRLTGSGKTMFVTGGTNSKSGTFTLATGAATVANTSITANSIFVCWLKTASGAITAQPYATAITAGTSCVISGGAGDNSVYNYIILESNQ